MGRVLAIVYRVIETHLVHKAGLTRTSGRTGAVTLIQRFGSALNLNIHFYMLFLDGVYVMDKYTLAFRWVKPLTDSELAGLVQEISQRIGRYLECQGLLVRDIENSYLTVEPTEESAMDNLLGHSISYRIAIGPQAGRKAFTLQTASTRGSAPGSGKIPATDRPVNL